MGGGDGRREEGVICSPMWLPFILARWSVLPAVQPRLPLLCLGVLLLSIACPSLSGLSLADFSCALFPTTLFATCLPCQWAGPNTLHTACPYTAPPPWHFFHWVSPGMGFPTPATHYHTISTSLCPSLLVGTALLQDIPCRHPWRHPAPRHFYHPPAHRRLFTHTSVPFPARAHTRCRLPHTPATPPYPIFWFWLPASSFTVTLPRCWPDSAGPSPENAVGAGLRGLQRVPHLPPPTPPLRAHFPPHTLLCLPHPRAHHYPTLPAPHPVPEGRRWHASASDLYTALLVLSSLRYRRNILTATPRRFNKPARDAAHFRRRCDATGGLPDVRVVVSHSLAFTGSRCTWSRPHTRVNAFVLPLPYWCLAAHRTREHPHLLRLRRAVLAVTSAGRPRISRTVPCYPPLTCRLPVSFWFC